MLHIVTRSAAIAIVAVLAFAATAQAECVSSTPSSLATNADTSLDNTSSAADIRELKVDLDADCQLTVRPVLLPLPVLAWQFLIVQFDLDGDEAIDVVVFVETNGAILDDGVDLIPLPTVPSAGFTVTLDELGLTTSPAQIGFAVESWFDDVQVVGDEVPGDFHPELDQPLLKMPVSFATPQPPPPTPPAPAAPVAPAAKQATGCLVPKLKGLTLKKAKAALKKAGCRYKVKGKGRVRSVSPKAGTRTDSTVLVKAKQKKHRKKRR